MPSSPLQSTPPASGGVTYYPAQFRAVYPNPRAALAALGCVGRDADRYLANAATEASPAVLVPVNFKPTGADCAAAVVHKPGGKAALWLGLIGEASSDQAAVHQLTLELSDAIGGTWGVFEWVRQSRAVQ